MATFANVVTIDVAPAQRDQLMASLAAHKARCLRDEPGTLQFEVLIPRDDDTKVLLYEAYQDAAAFEVHLKGRNFARWRDETAAMALKLHGTRCAVHG